MLRRALLPVTVVLTVSSAQVGHAASLTVLAPRLSRPGAPVASCDRTGVTTSSVTETRRGSPRTTMVTGVVVQGIDDGGAAVGDGACDGRTVVVELVDTAGAVVGAGFVLHAGDADRGRVTDDVVQVDTDDVDATLVADARVRIV